MKYHGNIGFAMPTEELTETGGHTGVWVKSITEKPYYGDILKKSYRWASSEHLNDNVDISNQISIVADSFARANIGNMRYATWSGNNWDIISAEVEYPRIRLVLGGVYNGPTP